MSHYKKLAGETLIYGLGTFLPRFLNFAFYTPYFTMVVLKDDPTAFGINSEIYNYIMFLMVFLTFGMETTFFKFSNDKRFEKEKIYSISFLFVFVVSLVVSGLIYWQAAGIKQIINFGGIGIHIKLVAGILFLDACAAIPFARMRNEKKILKFSFLKIMSVGANILFLLLFFNVKIQNGIPFLKHFAVFEDKISIILLANLLASLLVFMLVLKDIFKVRPSIDWKVLRLILVYASPLLISQLAGQINEAIDKIIFRHLVSSADGYKELGMYAASYRLGIILSIFNQMFRYASEPYFFSIADEKDSKKVYANMLKYFLIVSLFFFLAINYYVDFVKYYLGNEYREGLFILPVVLLSYVLSGILINVNYWFKISSNTKWAIVIIGGGAVITIISNLVLVPLFSYVGSAWSHVISNVFMIVLSYYLGKKFYNIDYNLKRLGFHLVLAGIFFILGYYIKIDQLIWNTCYVTLLILIYAWIVNKKENLIKLFLKR